MCERTPDSWSSRTNASSSTAAPGRTVRSSAWATAAGGGIVVAIAVIVAGLWLVAGAFLGGARWLILPALALALPAGVVSAANIDIDARVGHALDQGKHGQHLSDVNTAG